MLKILKVENVDYAGRKLATFSIVTQNELTLQPILPASMWLLSLAIRGNSDHTNESYASHLCQFFTVMTRFGAGHKNWKEVNEYDVNAYLFAYMHQERGLSEISIVAHASAISSFYSWAYEHGYLRHAVQLEDVVERCRKLSKGSSNVKKRVAVLTRQYINEKEFNKLLEKNDERNAYIQERNTLALKLGYYLGLRAEEIIQDGCLNTQTLKSIIPLTPNAQSVSIPVIGKGNKTRTVNAKPELVDDIRNFLYGRRSEIDDGPLISKVDGTQLNRQFASKTFRKLATKMDENYEVWLDRSFHVLRKCYATNLVTWCHEKGLDPWVLVVERLGHESIETTKIYIFFEAVINNRPSIISKLSLDNTSFKNIWGKTNG